MAKQNTTLGIWLMVLCIFIFAAQDGISRHLAGTYNVWMVVMIRYWFFAAFVIAMALRAPQGFKAAIKSHFLGWQITRGALLALEICVAVAAFAMIGLIGAHAIFAAAPLIVAALSGPILGEKVGWRRWSAIGVGMIGILIILKPGAEVFTPASVLALLAAVMYAVYGILTRYVGRKDSASVSLFWTGTIGAVVMTAIGPFFWQNMAPWDWAWMGLLCCTGIISHWLMIKVYEIAEASAVQPLAYLQLVFVSIIGVTIFDETVAPNVILGAAIVVAAGLFTVLRTARLSQRP